MPFSIFVPHHLQWVIACGCVSKLNPYQLKFLMGLFGSSIVPSVSVGSHPSHLARAAMSFLMSFYPTRTVIIIVSYLQWHIITHRILFSDML